MKKLIFKELEHEGVWSELETADVVVDNMACGLDVDKSGLVVKILFSDFVDGIVDNVVLRVGFAVVVIKSVNKVTGFVNGGFASDSFLLSYMG